MSETPVAVSQDPLRRSVTAVREGAAGISRVAARPGPSLCIALPGSSTAAVTGPQAALTRLAELARQLADWADGADIGGARFSEADDSARIRIAAR